MPPDLYAGGGGAWATGQLTQHGDPDGDAGAVLNVPIAEGTAAFRGLVYGGIDGGYIDDRRRDENDINRVRTLGARGAIRVSVAPDRRSTSPARSRAPRATTPNMPTAPATRKHGGEGQRVSVRVKLGGRRSITKNK